MIGFLYIIYVERAVYVQLAANSTAALMPYVDDVARVELYVPALLWGSARLRVHK